MELEDFDFTIQYVTYIQWRLHLIYLASDKVFKYWKISLDAYHAYWKIMYQFANENNFRIDLCDIGSEPQHFGCKVGILVLGWHISAF